MITCPFCHKHVHLARDGRDTCTLLSDQDTDDFDCPTMVEPIPHHRWHHYSRTTQKGTHTRYSAVFPPFEINWSTDGKLEVCQLTHEEISGYGTRVTTAMVMLQKENTTFEDFIRTANRFKILVPFI
jgi:hypothetical protein